MPEEISIRGEIEQALARIPFHSFVIKLASGDRYEVTHRFQVAVGQAVLVLLPLEGPSVYVRLNQIVALEIPTPA